MSDHLVIGGGQVGTALAKVLGCEIRDIENRPELGTFSTIHITFPYSDHAPFRAAVKSYRLRYDANLVVIHSTVPPSVFRDTNWVMSPVRGRHPNLYDGIRTFVKHFGGERAAEAAAPFRRLGVPVKLHDKAETLAVAKLVELAQFGVEVAMMKEIEALCRANDVPFEEVYTQFGRTYNHGYEFLGEYRFTKPILEWSEGPIGGHCVSENYEELRSEWFGKVLYPVSKHGWGHDNLEWR